MATLIGFLLIAQQLVGLPGALTWMVPGDYDTTVLQYQDVNYEVAFGAGCEGFGPDIDVLIVAGSGGVASLMDADGNGLCNVLIGAPVE